MARLPPVPKATKLRMKKLGQSTIRRITVPDGIETSYLSSLLGGIHAVSNDINRLVKSLANDMVKYSLLQQEAVFDAAESVVIESMKLELSAIIESLKGKHSSPVEANTLASAFVTQVNMSSQQALYKSIQEKYGVSRGALAVRDDVAVPFNKKVKDNVDLITNVSDKYLSQVESVILKNFSVVSDVSLIDEIIDEREGVAQNRARLIARDQTAKTTEAFNETRYRNFGIKQAIWLVADFSTRTRTEHIKLNGTTFDIDKGALISTGEYIFPASEVQCRCTSVPIIPDGLFD